MLFNVPQYIDVEDKVAGPLTAKQLGWLFGMGAVLLILYGVLEKTYFYIAAVPIVLIFVALAFYRPYNQPLVFFLMNAFIFIFRPRMYVWKRSAQPVQSEPTVQKNGDKEKLINAHKSTPQFDQEKMEMFAKVLDSRGRESSEQLIEILKKQKAKK